MSSYIGLENICFGYNKTQIINGVNLDIEKGKFVSIVGPNGSGKSTLLKIMTSINKPQNGQVLIENKNISEMSRKEIAKKLAVVPQNTAMEFDYKVIDVVLMGRYPFVSRLRGEVENDYNIAISSLKYTNTLHLAERSFMELSGGEKQRVILAQALTQQPQILVLDEPISHLDLQHQIEILNLIKKMCIDTNLTVIAVLHDLNMASTYSDEIIMLKEGSVFCSGEPNDVLNRKNIKDIFNIDVYVTVSVIGHKPYIYSLPKPHISKKDIRVHVICGGGSGSGLLKELYLSGYNLTSGILTVGDQDWKTARECELEISEEIPFIEISDRAYDINKQLITKADYIILTDLYFGKANIKNLEVLLDEDVNQRKILVLDDENFKSRDYTDGYGTHLYEKIKKNPNTILVSLNELKSVLG